MDSDRPAAMEAALKRELIACKRELSQVDWRSRFYFNLAPEYIMLVRVEENGSVIFEDINPATEAMYGRPRDAVVGLPVLDVLPSPVAADIERHARACCADEKVRSYQALRSFAGGPEFFIDVVAALVERIGETGGLVVFTSRDITEQRRVEEQLRQSQKMEAVGQLTGGLAHDFNNLLMAITGSLDMLQARLAQGRVGETGRYIDAAQGAVKRAAALTHRLLAFSRRQTLAPQPTDANLLIRGMEDMLRRAIGPGIALQVVAAPDLWTCLVDPSQLENALLNLSINARDAMPGGGRIVVETENRQLDERGTRDRDALFGPYVTVSVSDDGTGMAPEVASRAFDPFFTTKPAGEGTGLGLSMIYGFAQQSGGQVRITSEVGTGTAVILYFPRHFGAPQNPKPEVARRPHVPNEENLTVLVVDDEITVRMLIREALEDLGYRVIEAIDGPSGLRVLESSARIDLLITDIGLPGGMDGRRMAALATAGRPALTVIFVSGYAKGCAVDSGDLGTGAHVLMKPFSIDSLMERIAALGSGS